MSSFRYGFGNMLGGGYRVESSGGVSFYDPTDDLFKSTFFAKVLISVYGLTDLLTEFLLMLIVAFGTAKTKCSV